MVKFNYIIGNPPYQDDTVGDSNTALPLYHHYMKATYELADVVELITPARFLFNAGRTPKEFNEQMLQDPHLKVISYEKDASTVFPGTDIKGGVAVTYHDKNKEFTPIGVFTQYEEMNSIISKMVERNEPSIASLCFVASKFNIENLVADYPQYQGHERRLSSNVLGFDCFHDTQEDGDISIYGIYGRSRQFRYVNKKYIDMSDANIPRYKIVLPKADGNGIFGDTITSPEILPEYSGFTHTFLGMGGFDTKAESENASKYIKTKFARALLSILKVTQDVNADKWRYVPLQDFTDSSDIDWSVSVPEIDQQLYRKYNLTPEEAEFIETHVKPME